MNAGFIRSASRAPDGGAIPKQGTVDLHRRRANANPKPSLNGVPTIFTSQVPAELIVFREGTAGFRADQRHAAPAGAEQTGRPSSTPSTNAYYVLLRALVQGGGAERSLDLRHNDALPADDFARIPPAPLRAAVFPTVARDAAGAGPRSSRTRVLGTATVSVSTGRPSPNPDGAPVWLSPVPARRCFYVTSLVGADHPGDRELILRGAGQRLVHGARPDRSVDHRGLGARGVYHDPAVVADLSRHPRCHESTPQVVLRLHAGLPRDRRLAVRLVPTAPAIPAAPWIGTTWYAPPALWLRGVPGLQPLRGYTRLRGSAWRRRRADPYWGWGGLLLRPGYWGGYSAAGDGERQRLRPPNTAYSGDALVVLRAAASLGTTASGFPCERARTGTTSSYSAGRQLTPGPATPRAATTARSAALGRESRQTSRVARTTPPPASAAGWLERLLNTRKGRKFGGPNGGHDVRSAGLWPPRRRPPQRQDRRDQHLDQRQTRSSNDTLPTPTATWRAATAAAAGSSTPRAAGPAPVTTPWADHESQARPRRRAIEASG